MLNTLVEKLKTAIPGLLAIYRFGSWDTASARRDSDIDLAVWTRQPLDPVRRWEVAQDLASEAGRDVDLVDLVQASTVMRAQVVAAGERLYCADRDACEAFEDRAFSDYARLNEERRFILDDIRHRGWIHG